MKRNLLKGIICLLMLMAACGTALAQEEEILWANYALYETDDCTYGYQVSPDGNARLESFGRKLTAEALNLAGSNPKELERRQQNIVVTLPSEINGQPVTDIAPIFLMDITTPTGIVLPQQLVDIGGYAFARCSRLKETVDIPETVKRIGGYAFSSCPNLRSVRIPRSVTVIDEGAFTDCEKLKLTVARGSCAERYAIANDIPYVYDDSAAPLSGELSSPVVCYASDRYCLYYADPAQQAAGNIPGNTPVTVYAVSGGFAQVSFGGSSERYHVAADDLLLIPIRTPEQFGLHETLSGDGRTLGSMESEQMLRQYAQDVQLWNSYLCRLDVFMQEQPDATALRGELALELYKYYDENLAYVMQMELMIDFESLMEFDVFSSLLRSINTVSTQMPTLRTLHLFAQLLGGSDTAHAHENALEWTELYKTVEDIAGAKKAFSAEELERIADFMEKVDDLPIIDDVGDVLEDFFDAANETKLGKTIRPLLKKGGELAKDELELLGVLLPYMELAFHMVDIELALYNMSDLHQAALAQVMQNGDGSLLQIVVQTLGRYDEWYQYYIQLMAAQYADALSQLGLGLVPYGELFSVSTAAGALYLQLSGTTDAALEARDQLLYSYLAQELLTYGVAVELFYQLSDWPDVPASKDLDQLEALVTEYARLFDIAKGSDSHQSAFAREASQAIASSRACGSAPYEPLLIHYQPER